VIIESPCWLPLLALLANLRLEAVPAVMDEEGALIPPGTFHTFQEFFLGERGGVAALIKASGSIVARDCNAIERRQGSKKRQRSEKRHRSSFRVCLALLRGCSNHAPLSCVMQAGGPRLACSEAAIR
jgi:hypothetical protein